MGEQIQANLFETTEEKQRKKIAQLKAKLQKEEALFNHKLRKKRDGQLIAMGILMEKIYKDCDEEERVKWRKKAEEYLKERNLERVLAAFLRLNSDE